MKWIKIIIYALSVLLMLSAAFFLFSFAYTSIETISAKNIQAELIKKQDEAKELSLEHGEWMNVEEEYKGFKDNYLMKSERYTGFKQELQTTFRKYGLRSGPLKYKINNFFFDVTQITISGRLTGTYDNIKRFVFEIESKKEMVLFKKIRLSKKKIDLPIEGEFAMEVYFVK